jgi:hypothetical protein
MYRTGTIFRNLLFCPRLAGPRRRFLGRLFLLMISFSLCRELLHGQEAGGRELGGGAGQVRGGGGHHPRPRRQVRAQDLNLSPRGPQYIKKSYRLGRCGFDR